MLTRSSAKGATLLLAGMAALGLVMAGPASAAAPTTPAASAVPSPTCKIPSLAITPAAGGTGTVVTVKGLNFSGCKLKTGTITPTAVLKVEVGLLDPVTKKSTVLATVSTTATGAFTASITIPALTGTTPKVSVAAASVDPATKLDYAAVLPFAFTAATGTGNPGTAIPTAVPAGLGDRAATTSAGTKDAQLAVGAAGVLLAAGATLMLRRRRRSGEHS